jgi:hypothetical protein
MTLCSSALSNLSGVSLFSRCSTNTKYSIILSGSLSHEEFLQKIINLDDGKFGNMWPRFYHKFSREHGKAL